MCLVKLSANERREDMYRETFPMVQADVPNLTVAVRRREWSVKFRTWTLTLRQQDRPVTDRKSVV